MNTGAPGQKSKLVESFLLLSLFRLPLRPPSAWPGRCKPLRQVALPCEADSAAGLRGQRWPERPEAAGHPPVTPGHAWSPSVTPGHPRTPAGTDGRQPRTPRRRHQTFPCRDNTSVKPEGNPGRPSLRPLRARSCPGCRRGTQGHSRGARAPRVPTAGGSPGGNASHSDLLMLDGAGRAVPAHTWGRRLRPGSIPGALAPPRGSAERPQRPRRHRRSPRGH